MPKKNKSLAIVPGSFDPITFGHLDIIKRGAKLFDEIVVAIGDNPDKKALFSVHERIELIKYCLKGIENVRVESYSGLTVDFADKIGATTILRGLRNAHDMQYEAQIAITNKSVSGIETMFLITSPEHAFTSSTLIRQVAAMGGDVNPFVPAEVAKRIKSRHPA